jgi:c-di-GMP-binding flagellar brake protein YcgR
MAMFGFGKTKDGAPASDQILAYLEDALRARSPFTVVVKAGETAAFLHSVNEEANRFQLLPKEDLPVEKGGKVAFTFIHDGLRIGGTALALEVRPGILALKLPESLELMERRRKPRARLNAKEAATVTALQGLDKGVGINGDAENISEGGCRVRVTKAMAMGSEKRLVVGVNLVPPGQAFMLIKLNNLPRCPPVVETPGRAVHLSHDGGGLAIGFAFNTLPGPVEAVIRSLVGSRTSPTPAVLPPKLRRRPEAREAEAEAKPEPGPVPEGPAPEPVPEQAPEAPAPPEAVPAPELQAQVPLVDRRQAPRLSLGPGFHARFMIGDLLFAEVDLLDVSIGGCCLRLSQTRSEGVRKGVVLDEFHFVHPDLPPGVLQGRVKWILGGNPGGAASGGGAAGPRYCLVGVEFSMITAGLAQAITDYVSSHL